MTKKQALNYLKSSGFSKEQIQAVVEALSSSEMPNKEIINNDLGVDCISRQEAIDTIRQLYLDLASQKAVIDLIKALTPVTPQEPTTKNDLPHCQHTDEEIAKSFIEDVEAVKEQLPCGEQMDFPNTFDEFANEYGFKDKDEIYTNGSELISVFRVKQWLEHISTTKNDLGVDAISRSEVLKLMQDNWHTHNGDWAMQESMDDIRALPSVTPIRPKGHWLDTGWISECSCCHERSYPFDDAGYGSIYNYFCPNCGADMREVVEE